MGSESDITLLARWRADDREAYAVLVARHYGLVQAACRRQAPPGEAEDCTQAVFLILARKPASASRSPVLAAWLQRVAWFVCRNAQRIDRRRRTAERDAAASRTPMAEPSEALDHLDGCLLRLPDRQRAAVTLHYLTGRTPDEVAAALGTSRDNAYQLISRGLAGLRAQLSRRGVAVTGLAGLLAAEVEAATASPLPPILPCLSTTPSVAVSTLATGAIRAMTINALAPLAAAAGLLLATAIATVALTAEPTPAAPPVAAPAASAGWTDAASLTPQARAAVDKGLAWLVANQLENGSWPQQDGTPARPGVVAICTLGLLAANGVANDEARTRAIGKAIAVLRGQTDMIGSTMYDHGFSTLCLAEAAILTADASLRQDVDRAVALIIQAQNPQGGWRYMPKPLDADISVTATQLVALRAAVQAGVDVPMATFVRALGYVRTCCSLTGDGGFGYLPGMESGFARTGAGSFTLLAVAGDDRMVQDGLAFLLRFRPLGTAEMKESYWYAHYYAAAAMRMAQATGPVQRQVWADWYAGVSAEIVACQQDDGHWNDRSGSTATAAPPATKPANVRAASRPDPLPTALACIILQMPQSRLPVFDPRSDIRPLLRHRVPALPVSAPVKRSPEPVAQPAEGF